MKFYYIQDIEDMTGAFFTTKKSALKHIKELNNMSLYEEGLYENEIPWTKDDIQTLKVNVKNKKTILWSLKDATTLANNTFSTPEFE